MDGVAAAGTTAGGKARRRVTSPSRAAATRAPAADTPEPAPIATRTLRGDPAERPRAPKEAQAAKVASRNTEAKAPAAEPAGNQTQPVPASDHAGNDDKAAAIAIHHGEATIAETHVVQDAAPAKTPDIPKTLPTVGATPPGAPASPNPAATTAPAAAGLERSGGDRPIDDAGRTTLGRQPADSRRERGTGGRPPARRADAATRSDCARRAGLSARGDRPWSCNRQRQGAIDRRRARQRQQRRHRRGVASRVRSRRARGACALAVRARQRGTHDDGRHRVQARLTKSGSR